MSRKKSRSSSSSSGSSKKSRSDRSRSSSTGSSGSSRSSDSSHSSRSTKKSKSDRSRSSSTSSSVSRSSRSKSRDSSRSSKDSRESRSASRDRRHRSRNRSSSRRRSKSPFNAKATKIYVGRLSKNVNKDHVNEIFCNYGVIKSIELPADYLHPFLSRGFAYVDFEKSEDAEKAIKYMDGGQIDGQVINVSIAIGPRPKAPRNFNSRRPGWRAHSPPRHMRRRRSPRRSPRRQRRSISRSPSYRRRGS